MSFPTCAPPCATLTEVGSLNQWRNGGTMFGRIQLVGELQKLGFEASEDDVFLTGQLAQDALSVSKVYAWALARGPAPMGHRHALEVIARAAGWQSWHMMQAFCVSEEREATGDQWAEHVRGQRDYTRLKSTLPMLVPPRLDALGRQPHQHWAIRVAAAASISVPQALEVIAATVRHPVWQRPLPLYTFVAPPGQHPGLRESKACLLLTKELDEMLEGPVEEDRALRQAAAARATTSVLQHEDFLYGYFVSAWMMELERVHAFGETFQQGIDKAEALLPRNFRGKLDDEPATKVYGKLLRGRLYWMTENGQVEAAIALARKILSLGLDPRWETHYDLVGLLGRAGRPDEARAVREQMEYQQGRRRSAPSHKAAGVGPRPTRHPAP